MSYTREEFVKKYSSSVAKATEGTGLLVGTVLSQAIIESSGKVGGHWRVGGSKLAREANNYFGIKCHKKATGWKGKTYNISTGEYTPAGKYFVETDACFRAYNSVKDSIKDYVKFMKSQKRYKDAGVFKAKTVKEQAEALKRGKYATSPDYPKTVKGVYDSIKGFIVKTSKSQAKFATQHWLAILLISLGIGTIVYVSVTSRK